MALSLTAIRMVVLPHKGDTVRAWLDEQRKQGDRIAYLEIPGVKLRTFIVHGDPKPLRALVKMMPLWGARTALT